MADEQQDVRSLLSKIAAGGSDDTPGGSHPTEQDLKEDSDNQSTEKETDKTVQDVGEPNVEEGKTEPEKDNPPAQVSEEASTDQSGDTQTPGGGHPTEQDLKEEPTKKAELAQKVAEQSGDVVDSIDALLESTGKEAADEKQEGEDPDSMNEEESDDSSESDSSADDSSDSSSSESSNGSEDDKKKEDYSEKSASSDEAGKLAKQAGREAAQQVALMAYQQAMGEKQAAYQAEMSKFAQMGQGDAMALADQLDAGVNQALGGGAPKEGPGQEPTKSLEEVKAVAQTLLDGKQPETPEEQDIAEFLDWVKSQMGGSDAKSDTSSKPPKDDSETQSGESEPAESAKKEEMDEGKEAALNYLSGKTPEEVVSILSELNDQEE